MFILRFKSAKYFSHSTIYSNITCNVSEIYKQLRFDIIRLCQTHLEDFDYNFFIVAHIDGLKNFTVLPSTQFAHQLIIVLIAGMKGEIVSLTLKPGCQLWALKVFGQIGTCIASLNVWMIRKPIQGGQYFVIQIKISSEIWHLGNVSIPPTWHMCIVIPVFPALLSVDIGVHPSFAASRGTGHCELGRSMSRWFTFHYSLLGDGLERSAQTYRDVWRYDLCVELSIGMGWFCSFLTYVCSQNVSVRRTCSAYKQCYDE